MVGSLTPHFCPIDDSGHTNWLVILAQPPELVIFWFVSVRSGPTLTLAASLWRFLGVDAFAFVESVKVDIEHLPQAFRVFECIAAEIESDARADGAPRPQKTLLRIGFYNQFRLCHANGAPLQPTSHGSPESVSNNP